MYSFYVLNFFFFKQKTAYEMRISDWSSDVCSSDLQVENEITTHGANEPFAHVASHAIHARNHHAKYGALKLEEKGSTGAFVTRTIRKVIDEETARLENGLTVLDRKSTRLNSSH